ncbi:DUF6894 family protein [Rhizobium herbae]|jgi:hypothetical protein
MKYFFHSMGDGRFYEDEGGEEFGNTEDAIRHAQRISAQLAEGGGFAGLLILLMNGTGEPIGQYRVASKSACQAQMH